MKEILVATRNKKKLLELKRLLKGSGVRVLSLDYFDNLPKVKEDKRTFEENAKKKALEISSQIDKLVMADDSGLEVPALGNAPGVNSARYAGPAQNDARNITKLLDRMKNLSGKRRKAHFKCVICLSKGKRVMRILEGKVKGMIAEDSKGNYGFGYDPVFVPDGFEKTFAQLGPRIKDRISHRSIALKKARDVIQEYFQRYS